MSYLYNMYQGSLAELSTAFGQVDLTDPETVTSAVLGEDPDPDDVEDLGLSEGEPDEYVTGPLVLAALIERSWTDSPGELLNWLDWHEEDQLLQLAALKLSERGSEMLVVCR